MSELDKIPKEEIESLVASAQKGSTNAFGKLYDIFIQPIYRYIYYRANRDEAEDLTEMVFLKTWEHIRKYHRGQSSFSAWIFRIAHNVVIDYYRESSDHRNQELSEKIEDQNRESYADTRTHRSLSSELLADAMSKLKDKYRQIVILKYVNGLSNVEIAQIMGKSQTALRILQFRALRMLRRLLKEKGITESD